MKFNMYVFINGTKYFQNNKQNNILIIFKVILDGNHKLKRLMCISSDEICSETPSFNSYFCEKHKNNLEEPDEFESIYLNYYLNF